MSRLSATADAGSVLMGSPGTLNDVAQVSGGVAIPFAIWLGLKLMADILTVLNRSFDRLDALEERFGGIAQHRGPKLPPAGPRALRASDDGPNYQVEE